MEVFTSLQPGEKPAVLFRLLYRRLDGTDTNSFTNGGDLVAANPSLPIGFGTAD